MAVLAGETIIAGKIPGERIATDIVTANSATITSTETVVQTVTAALVSGRIYRIKVSAAHTSTLSEAESRFRIREDNVSGTVRQTRLWPAGHVAGDAAPVELECEFTAASTGNKTFVLTMVREEGGGNHVYQAAANNAAYFYVDYIRG